jgi:hypothetical protein
VLRCFLPASLRIDSATLTLSSPSTTVDPTSVPGPSTSVGAVVALHPTGTGLAILDGTMLRWFLKVNGTWVGNASVTLPPPFAQPLDVQAAAGRAVVVGESLIALADPAAGTALLGAWLMHLQTTTL